MRKRHDLATHSSHVALAPARALTSHLRRHYETRYRGRYPLAHIVFTIDMSLVALVLALIGVNIYLATMPSPVSGVRLFVTAPPIQSAVPLSLEATIVSQDKDAHENLVLTWDLPPGSEILTASPALNEHRSVSLGSLPAGQTLTARVVVRLFVPPGEVRLGFRLQDMHAGHEEHLTGEEIRPVVSSGLQVEPLLKPNAIASRSAIPFLIKNITNLPLEDVELMIEGGAATFFGLTSLPLGTLEPFSSHVFLVDPRGSNLIRVRAVARGISLSTQTLPIKYTNSIFPIEKLTLAPSTPGQDAELSLHSTTSTQLFVFHPLLKDAPDHVKIRDIAAGFQTLNLPLEPLTNQILYHWLAVPFFTQDGQMVLGPAVEQVVTTPFDFTAAARFYTSMGDQVGVGPLPPRVGQTTKYWINWKLDATRSDLSDFTVRATLPPGVTLTGRNALPQDGELRQQGEEITWRIPYLEANTAGTMASFEVALTPISVMRGHAAKLLGPTHVTAVETRNQVSLQADAPALDTNLIGDPKAEGQGVVK
ncbi:hypothetical protein EXS71_00635 [Candidatus Uhrbacteria bacterium]|nr:hypothetical protein [Candidatus Uhrbacteria bacterium]